MQKDFHYFATCCAAMLAGWSVDESLEIATCAQMVDLCSRTFLAKVKGPKSAVTTQLQLELMQARTDLVGLQDITRIWASFHFLPGDLTARPPRKTGLRYQQKYRLICQPNGPLVKETVELARGKGTAAAGLAMHVLADTWAHRNFAGTPSLVINNTNYYFYEILNGSDRMVNFRHSPGAPDDLVMGVFSNSVYQDNENSIMTLGHGRARLNAKLAHDQDVAQDDLQRILFRVKQVQQRAEIGIPVPDGVLHRDDGDDRFGKGQHELPEKADVAAAVDLRGFQ